MFNFNKVRTHFQECPTSTQKRISRFLFFVQTTSKILSPRISSIMNGEHHQLQESPVSPGSSGFVNSSSPVPIEAVKHQRQRDEKEDFGSASVPSVSVVDPGSSSRPVLNQSGLRKRKKKKKSVLQVHQSKKTKTKMNFKCTKCSHSVALPRQKEDLEKLQLALDTRKRQVDETAASGMAFPTSSESDEDSDAEIPLLNNNNSYQHSAAAHALKNDATSSYNSVSSPSSSSTKGMRYLRVTLDTFC